MIVTLVALVCLAIGTLFGVLLMSVSKPLVVEPPTRTITHVPLVPAVTRKQHQDVWN